MQVDIFDHRAMVLSQNIGGSLFRHFPSERYKVEAAHFTAAVAAVGENIIFYEARHARWAKFDAAAEAEWKA